MAVLGELKFNVLSIIKFSGKVRAVYGPGLVFVLDAPVDLHLLDFPLANSHLYIRASSLSSVVRASSHFMGSDINIEMNRRGLSIEVLAQDEN